MDKYNNPDIEGYLEVQWINRNVIATRLITKEHSNPEWILNSKETLNDDVVWDNFNKHSPCPWIDLRNQNVK